MARRPYVPSGKSDPGALPPILFAAVIAGLLTGALEGFVSQWFNLLLIFPAALGAVIGGVAGQSVTKRHVRMPLAVAAIGLAAGILGGAAVHGVAYFQARSKLGALIERDPRAADYIRENGLRKAVDVAFGGEEGTLPILGFFKQAAEAGITIKGHGSSGSEPTLTGIGVYILWIAELFVICGIAIAMLVDAARKPFCEGCNAWYDRRVLLGTGAGDKATLKQVSLHLENGQYADALRGLGTSDAKTASSLMLNGCSKCNAHEPVLEFTGVSGLKGKKPQRRSVFVTLITATEASQLLQPSKPAAPA